MIKYEQGVQQGYGSAFLYVKYIEVIGAHRLSRTPGEDCYRCGMDINWFFCIVFVVAYIFEYFLSVAYAECPLMHDKGLHTDILASLTVLGVSYFAYWGASMVNVDCERWKQLPDFDYDSCIKLSNGVYNFADILDDTLGFNPVFITIIMFFVIKYRAPIFETLVRWIKGVYMLLCEVCTRR